MEHRNYNMLAPEDQDSALKQRIREVEQSVFVLEMELGEFDYMAAHRIVLPEDVGAVQAEMDTRRAQIQYHIARLEYLNGRLGLLRDTELTSE